MKDEWREKEQKKVEIETSGIKAERLERRKVEAKVEDKR